MCTVSGRKSQPFRLRLTKDSFLWCRHAAVLTREISFLLTIDKHSTKLVRRRLSGDTVCMQPVVFMYDHGLEEVEIRWYRRIVTLESVASKCDPFMFACRQKRNPNPEQSNSWRVSRRGFFPPDAMFIHILLTVCTGWNALGFGRRLSFPYAEMVLPWRYRVAE
jgi:hypothetical protein